MKKLIILYTGLCLLLSACKKGEDDPAISLRSRKARVEGNWKLEKAQVSLGIKDSTGAYKAWDYQLESETYSMTNTSKGANFKGKSSLNISFTKNGTFDFKQVMDTYSLEASGNWDFQAGVGKHKNKEMITLRMSTIRGNSNRLDLLNKSNIDFTYRIKELRNKKMVLVCNEEMILLDSGMGVYVTAEYTFVQ